jgi:hypothetical protein
LEPPAGIIHRLALPKTLSVLNLHDWRRLAERSHGLVETGVYLEEGVETGQLQHLSHRVRRGEQFDMLLRRVVAVTVNCVVGIPASIPARVPFSTE